MLEHKSEQRVWLCYGVRSADSYLFGDLIARCEAELPGFRKSVWCEDGSIPGEKGLLNIDAINDAASAASLFYLSGPPSMIRVFKARLMEFGVGSENIRVDDWE